MIHKLLKKEGIKLFVKDAVCTDNITVIPELQNKAVTANGTYTADEGYAGLGEVTVNVEGEKIPDGYILPSGTKSITENGTYPVAEFKNVDVQVEGGGSGECNRKHITELEELPTDGLVEGETYKVKKKALLSIVVNNEEGLFPDYFGYLVALVGALFGIEDGKLPENFYRYSKEVPTDNPDVSDLGAYCYVESEDMLYAYTPEMGTWVSMADVEDSDLQYIGSITSIEQVTEYGAYAYLGYEGTEFYEIVPESYKVIILLNGAPTDVNTMLPCEVVAVPTLPTENIKASTDNSFYCYYAQDQQDVFIHYGGEWVLLSSQIETSFGGMISSTSQATDEDSFYLLTNNGGLMNYFHPEGQAKVTNAGIYDVERYTTVNVVVPTSAVYGKRKLALSNIPTDLTVPVNFTTVYQGETINCTKMSFIYGLMDDGVTISYYKEDGTQIEVFYDGLSAGTLYEGTSLYVDFGSEPQLVVKEFAEYMAQSPQLVEIAPIADITFTVNGVEYSANPTMSWCEFATNTTGFTSYSYWSTSVYKDNTEILYNGKYVNSYDTIIDGAVYVTKGTIAFTINGINHYANENMTWSAWVESDFNKDGYVINAEDNTVWYGTERAVLYNENPVAATDTIIGGVTYNHASG